MAAKAGSATEKQISFSENSCQSFEEQKRNPKIKKQMASTSFDYEDTSVAGVWKSNDWEHFCRVEIVIFFFLQLVSKRSFKKWSSYMIFIHFNLFCASLN